MTTSTAAVSSAPSETRSIRQVRATAFAGPETLDIVTAERPTPGPGQVLVAVAASSATTSDSIVRRGLNPYMGDLEPPFVLGYDLVGVVAELGSGVSGLSPGDRVVAITRWGANADAVVAPAAALTVITSDVEDVLVEPMVMTGATAAAMVRRLAPVSAGDRVYVQGASGGVGLIAVQAALLLGAEVVAAASAEKLPVLRELGATAVDRRDPRLLDAVREFAPDGVQVALDAAGGDGITRAAATLADGGTLITFGYAEASRAAGGRSPEVLAAVGEVFDRSARALAAVDASPRGLRGLQFDITGLREQDPAAYADDVAWLLDHVAAGRLAPVIRRVALEDAAAAHRALDDGAVTGRLVLDHALTAGA